MNLSLTGKSRLNEHTLLGKSNYNIKSCVPNEIKNIKTKILNDYLIPLYKKQWSKLHENLFFIHKIKQKISKYKHLSNYDDLQLYIDLVQLLEIVVEKNKLLESQEDKFKTRFGSKEKAQQDISMIFRLTPIRLLPEYELYNNIIGKPKRELNESYDMEKIRMIKTLLERENMDYEQMKQFLENII
jgi:hypothetical protein